MKILLTAFTPFDGESINPALEAMKLLPDKIGNLEVLKLEVPTVFGKSANLVLETIEQEKPDFVLSIGQAGGRAEITPERIAINIDDARIPDNEGNQPVDQPIYLDGENAYFSTLPVKAMVEAIKKEGLPTSLSNSAGTYVCNHLMYSVLYYIQINTLPIKAGFIHVPYIPEQTKEKKDKPSLPLQNIVKGLKASIEAISKKMP
ncbi:pyroglutamyl-peptidase I [Oribacterium sp.]